MFSGVPVDPSDVCWVSEDADAGNITDASNAASADKPSEALSPVIPAPVDTGGVIEVGRAPHSAK